VEHEWTRFRPRLDFGAAAECIVARLEVEDYSQRLAYTKWALAADARSGLGGGA